MPPKREHNTSGGSNSLAALAAAAATTAQAVSADSSNHNDSAAPYAGETAAEQRQQLYVANTKLCRLVRKCPWMYDRHHENYGKKHILDKSWTKIAKDCNDSVASCKDRWRNIRAAFARSINLYKTHGGPNRVKPYYLHKELTFLVKPMLDGRDKSKVDYEETKEELEEEDDADEEDDEPEEGDDNTEEDEENGENDTTELDMPAKSSTVLESLSELTSGAEQDLHVQEVAKSIHAYELETTVASRKRAASGGVPTEAIGFKRIRLLPRDTADSAAGSHDADVQFLEVLLPDMRSMNARQKVIFKRKIYQSLQEVLESTADFPQCQAPPEQPISPTAQTIVKNVASLSESELQKLSAFMQSQLKAPGVATSPQRMQNGVATSTPHMLTVIPCAQQNGRTQPSSAAAGISAMSSGWEQLVPIHVKQEIDDVDVD